MRFLEAVEIAALAARVVIPRTLISIWTKDRDTGAEVFFGAWNGSENVAFSVYKGLDPATTGTRNFHGKGAVLDVDPIVLAVGFEIRPARVTLNPLDETTEIAFRGYDFRQARIEIHRALISTISRRSLVWHARPRFVGYIDKAPVLTPEEGGRSSITLECVSCTRELTRVNSDVRSDESQQRRAPGDGFFKYVGIAGQVTAPWGVNREAKK